MSKYELDDYLVHEFLGTLHESEDELPSGRLGKELRRQIPVPMPTKLGAIVQTRDHRIWILASQIDSDRWVCDPDGHGGGHLRWSSDAVAELGVVRIISEGVDL